MSFQKIAFRVVIKNAFFRHQERGFYLEEQSVNHKIPGNCVVLHRIL